MSGKKRDSGYRGKAVRVRTAKGRKPSSTRWLKRQLNDPYVIRSKREGYRSRAAYKLLEIDEKARFLKPGACVVDLGAAPGSWSQVAIEKGARVIAVDIQPIALLEGVTCIEGDFLEEETVQKIRKALPSGVNVVLSDMAAPASGHRATDHLRIMALCEAALEFAVEVLKPGGIFLAKVLQGGAETALLQRMKQHFTSVKHVKPGASRKDSSEIYVLAKGFRG